MLFSVVLQLHYTIALLSSKGGIQVEQMAVKVWAGLFSRQQAAKLEFPAHSSILHSARKVWITELCSQGFHGAAVDADRPGISAAVRQVRQDCC